MSLARTLPPVGRDHVETARVHSLLRFGVGTSFAFILSEALGWAPTFLAPVLLAVLFSSLPAPPKPKAGLALVLVMAFCASLAFALSTLLIGSKTVLTGAIALVVFLAFAIMAQGRAKLPGTLMLLSIATIPVIAILNPAKAGILPIALVRSMSVAILILWVMYAIWPRLLPQSAPAVSPPAARPIAVPLIGTAIVMPVMLVFLLFGLPDALAVIVTTTLLVANFDAQRGAIHALGMMLGNLCGGLIGLVAFLILGISPSLASLALITFLIAAGLAIGMQKGGAAAAIGLLTFNSSLIILSSAIASPESSAGVWIARLFQFALACSFAVGMMSLVWRGRSSGSGDDRGISQT